MTQLVKNPPAMVGNLGLIPGLGRSPGEGKDYPLQYAGLENSMDSQRTDTTERRSLSLSKRQVHIRLQRLSSVYNINNILTFSSVQFGRSFASDSL